jgi:hypothetical protein
MIMEIATVLTGASLPQWNLLAREKNIRFHLEPKLRICGAIRPILYAHSQPGTSAGATSLEILSIIYVRRNTIS